jgi:pilus assembly protein CpaC
MYVKPEVSSIDIANAVNFSGFRIPALSTRRIESNIELAPGQSFVIGGLLDERADEAFARIPGLASIPLLGVLFRSRLENRSRAELVVMVTPEVVDPLKAGDLKALPAMPMKFLAPTPAGVGPDAPEKRAAPPAARKPSRSR